MIIHRISLMALIIVSVTALSAYPEEKTLLALITAGAETSDISVMKSAKEGFRSVLASTAEFSLLDTSAIEDTAAKIIREERLPAGRLGKLLRSKGASKAIVFALEAHNGRLAASAVVLDIASSSFEYESREEVEPPLDATYASKILARRVLLHLAGKLDWIAALSAGKGDAPNGVRLFWSSASPVEGERYVIYRALQQDGEFKRIAETASTEFLDAGALPGVRYWYRARGSYLDTLTDFSQAEAGHRRAALPTGLDIDRVLKEKKAAPPRPSDRVELEKAKRDEEILKPLYRHPVKLNLILLIAKTYIKRGDVIILRGFDSYSTDPENASIEFTGPGDSYNIGFRSKRFFRFREKAGDELFERLLDNSLFFCVPSGEYESEGPDGTVVFLPRLEAIAISMEYHKNDRNWRERTVMFDTDVKKLREKIENAGKGTP